MAKKTSKNKVENRIPIVSILGHVDHGKTSLLDVIRGGNVQEGEAGGITQKISVFTVSTEADKQITFIDTPGHEAFDLMRVRGGNVADVVLLIVAADDGLKPQTLESIEIINSSDARPIVVINKVDLPNINIEKIKRDLAVNGMMIEGMGGSVPVVEVSAKNKTGIDTLLETISLVNEMDGFVSRPSLAEKVIGKAFVLESSKNKSMGCISNIVVTSGEFEKGQFIAYRDEQGEVIVEKAKMFQSEDKENITELGTGAGGRIIGLKNLLHLGTDLYCVTEKNEKKLEDLIPDLDKIEELDINEDGEVTDDEKMLAALFGVSDEAQEGEDEIKNFGVVIKASSQGSLEALRSLINGISIEGGMVTIHSAQVGDITNNDIETASQTKSLVVGFEVGLPGSVAKYAKESKVFAKVYDVIYKIPEEISDALTMMVTPTEFEEDLGVATIKQIFTLSNGQVVFGGRVDEGVIKKGVKCYIIRGDEEIAEGRITSLKHNKNEVKEMSKGNDFGCMVEPGPEGVQEGDEIHLFKMVRA